MVVTMPAGCESQSRSLSSRIFKTISVLFRLGAFEKSFTARHAFGSSSSSRITRCPVVVADGNPDWADWDQASMPPVDATKNQAPATGGNHLATMASLRKPILIFTDTSIQLPTTENQETITG